MTNLGSKRLRFSAYEVDLVTGELWKHGIVVKVAGQPFQILAYLVRRPGQLVSREELCSELWPGETFVDFDHGLNAAVNKLRLVLCDSAESPKYIETLPRRGYRFIAAVEEVRNGAAGVVGAAVVAGAAAETSTFGQGEMLETVSPAQERAAEIMPAEALRKGGDEMPRASWSRAVWVLGAVGALLCALLATQLAIGGFSLFARKVQTRANPQTRAAEARPATVSSLTSLADHTSQPAFSPDGSRVAFVREGSVAGSSGIWSKQIAGDEILQLTRDEGDCCAVWSPDGQWLAFSRVSDGGRKIYKIAARGGEVHELFAAEAMPDHAELDWSPDGKTIAYVGRGAEGAPAIFLRTVSRPGVSRSKEEQGALQITEPSALEEDWGPAFSPDGSRIAFVRGQNIMVISVAGKEVQHLIKTPGHIIGSPSWTPDGQSIVFALSNGGGPNLMRISASGGRATPIPEAGELALNPAIARRGFRLACDQLTIASSIEQIDLSLRGRKARTLVTTHNGESGGGQVSHDGSKLVYHSNRAGVTDVWISDRDGENPIRITAMGTASAPSWSPDDKEIAFEAGSHSSSRGGEGIFLVKSNGGEPWSLVQDEFNNRAPRWSNDGKWIYFGSNRSGAWQIWKVGAWGGLPVQVTHEGGLAAEESVDGRDIFYVKEDGDAMELWTMPVAGGAETRVTPAVHPLDWAAWAVAKDGLLFVEQGADGDAVVNLFNFASTRVKRLAVLDKPPFWMAATRDGRSVIFDQAKQFESHVALLEDFR